MVRPPVYFTRRGATSQRLLTLATGPTAPSLPRRKSSIDLSVLSRMAFSRTTPVRAEMPCSDNQGPLGATPPRMRFLVGTAVVADRDPRVRRALSSRTKPSGPGKSVDRSAGLNRLRRRLRCLPRTARWAAPILLSGRGLVAGAAMVGVEQRRLLCALLKIISAEGTPQFLEKLLGWNRLSDWTLRATLAAVRSCWVTAHVGLGNIEDEPAATYVGASEAVWPITPARQNHAQEGDVASGVTAMAPGGRAQ